MPNFSLFHLRGQSATEEAWECQRIANDHVAGLPVGGEPAVVEQVDVQPPITEPAAQPETERLTWREFFTRALSCLWWSQYYATVAVSLVPLFVGASAINNQKQYGPYVVSLGALNIVISLIWCAFSGWILLFPWMGHEWFSLTPRRRTFAAGLVFLLPMIAGMVVSIYWQVAVGCEGSVIDPLSHVRVHLGKGLDEVITKCEDMTNAIRPTAIILGIMLWWWTSVMALFYISFCRNEHSASAEVLANKEARQPSDVESNVS